MSINRDMNQIHELLCDIKEEVDNTTETFLKEISLLNDDIKLLHTEIEILDDQVTDLLITNNELKAQVAQLEIELIEAVMQNKRL